LQTSRSDTFIYSRFSWLSRWQKILLRFLCTFSTALRGGHFLCANHVRVVQHCKSLCNEIQRTHLHNVKKAVRAVTLTVAPCSVILHYYSYLKQPLLYKSAMCNSKSIFTWQYKQLCYIHWHASKCLTWIWLFPSLWAPPLVSDKSPLLPPLLLLLFPFSFCNTDCCIAR
jgi:hypothetical protein